MKPSRLLAAALLLAVPAAAAEPPGSAEQAKAMERIIHDYLLAHPEVVVEALQRAEDASKAKEAQAAVQVIAAHRSELEHDPNSPVLGNAAGDVTIVEFFDYRCPYCKAGSPVLDQLLAEDGRIRLVLKEFPILGKDSEAAAKIALVAYRHGKGAEFHRALFGLDRKVDEAAAFQAAASLGLSKELVTREMAAPEIAAALKKDYDLARAIGADGTPTFVIGDVRVAEMPGAEELKTYVANARKRGS